MESAPGRPAQVGDAQHLGSGKASQRRWHENLQGLEVSQGPGFEAGASVHLSLPAYCPQWQPAGSMHLSERPPEPTGTPSAHFSAPFTEKLLTAAIVYRALRVPSSVAQPFLGANRLLLSEIYPGVFVPSTHESTST